VSKEKDRARSRERRHLRVRRHVSGTAQRPRLCVYKSLRHYYAQVIDDNVGHTLAAASTTEAGVGDELQSKSGVDAAVLLGKTIAERALAAGVEQVVFDRGGWPYHGGVRQLAEAAREAGLKF
jgi:large subunit ribosomal protein L18